MPRGRKKKEALTLEEQLTKIAEEIAGTEARLKELKAQQKSLKADIEAEKTKELLAVIKESGMSLEEAIDTFAASKNATTENNEQ